MVLRASGHIRLRWLLILPALLLAAACGGGGSGGTSDTVNGDGDGTLVPVAKTFLAAHPTATPEPGSTPSQADPQAAIDAVVAEVLRRLIEVKEEDIEVVSATAGEYPDSCLGIVYAGEDVACEQVITPGFEVVVHFGDTTMTWRASEDGSVVRFVGQEIGGG